MAEPTLDSRVNEHYLNKVMDLAETMPVVATEDIFDARGMKLLAKGARVSNALQEKLILHKLKKPIESTLTVEGGVRANTVVETAQRILDVNRPLASILSTTGSGASSPLKILSGMALGNGMSMMLTISERDGSQAFEHAVTVSLLAIGIANKLRVSEQDLKITALAGLLHDIGELYIDPVYLARGKRILPHQWAHVAVHPRIGQMLISELESYPPGVSRAVAEHHERFDGSGYPRRIAGNQISLSGQIVAIAEMMSGMLATTRPLERAELALKIIPGEHAHTVLSAISGALHFSKLEAEPPKNDAAPPSNKYPVEEVEHLYARITSSLESARVLLSGASAKPQAIKDLLSQIIDRIVIVQRAFIGTGMDGYLNQSQMFSDCADLTIMFEKEVATREMQWRLRDIARDIALHSGAQSENSIYADLIRLLDDQTAQVVQLEQSAV